MLRKKLLALAIIVSTLGATPLSSIVLSQQKSEVQNQKSDPLTFNFRINPPLALSAYKLFATHGSVVDLSVTGLSSIPHPRIQLTQSTEPLMPVLTHRPFT